MVHGATHTGVGYPGAATLPNLEDIQKAAEILNKGKKVAMLVGAGALHATDEVIAVANRLNAGVAKALLGKAAVPDDLPFVTGSLGLLGTKPSWDLMKECDTFLMVGSAFPYSEFLPKPGDARGVQIDIDGANLSLRYPMEYSLIGDSKQTLAALLPLLEQNENRSWRESIEKDVSEWWEHPQGARDGAGRSGQPATHFPRTFAAASRRRHHDRRFRFGRELVCARHPDPARHDGIAFGRPGLAGSRHALCGRGEDGLSRSPRDRFHRRRRDADERAQRHDHGRANIGGDGPIRASS